MSNELFEFYKSLHERELDRRDSLNNSISTPIGLISAIIGVIFFFCTNYYSNCNIIVKFMFFILVLSSVIFVCTSIYKLIKFYNNGLSSGYEYEGLPYAKELKEYYDYLVGINKHNKKINSNIPDTEVEFRNYLIETFINTSGHNAFVNDKKAEYFYEVKKYIIFSIIPLLLSTILFAYNYQLNKEKTMDSKAEIFDSIQERLNILETKLDSLTTLNEDIMDNDENKEKTLQDENGENEMDKEVKNEIITPDPNKKPSSRKLKEGVQPKKLE